MTLVPSTRRSDLARELDLLTASLPPPGRYYPPYDFHVYPYHWDDARLWWPTSTVSDVLRRPLDDLVTRRVRNQLVQSTAPLEWSYPLRWENCYSGERVHVDEKGFQVDIDVRQYQPHDIVVKTTDDCVLVQGHHNRRHEPDGTNSLVERQFVRKYLLPRGYNANDVISNLSSDGVLTIKAPPPPPTKYYTPSERIVRVHETGRSALPWK